jgi:hypothetical protein
VYLFIVTLLVKMAKNGAQDITTTFEEYRRLSAAKGGTVI